MIQKLQRGNKLNLQYLGLVRPVVPGMTPNTSSTITYNPQEEQNKKKAAEEARERRKYQQNKQIISATPPRDESLFGIWRRQQDAQAYEQNRQEDAFKSGAAQVLPYFVPGIGQYLMVKDFSDALYEGRNGEAALMLGLTAAPFAFKGIKKLLPKTKNLTISQTASPVDNFFGSKRIFLTHQKKDTSYPSIKWGSADEIYFSDLPDELYTHDFIKTRYDTGIPDFDNAQKLFVDKINNRLGSNTTVERLFNNITGEVNQDEITRIYNDLHNDIGKGLFSSYWAQYAGYMDKNLIPFSKQRDAYKNGLQFASDYFHSPGYVERFNKQKFKYGSYPERKYIFPEENLVKWTEGKNNASSDLNFGLFDDRRFNFRLGETGTHEAFHWNPNYNTRSKVSGSVVNPESPYYNNDYRNIPKEIKDILKPSQDALNRRYDQKIGDLKHDRELSEQYSDLGALRYNLNKEGIFDSRKIGEQFNQKMLDMFRGTESAKTDRFLDLHTDDQIIKAINEIAENNNSNLNNYV